MSDTPGLDYYFDTMLDEYLDRHFEEAEDNEDGPDIDD